MDRIELAPSRSQGESIAADMREATLHQVKLLANDSGKPQRSDVAKALRQLANALEEGKVAGLAAQLGLQLAAHDHKQAPALLTKAKHRKNLSGARLPVEGWGSEDYTAVHSLLAQHSDPVTSKAWGDLPILPSWSPDMLEFAKVGHGFAWLSQTLPDHAAELNQLMHECILVPGDEIPWAQRQWARGFAPTWAPGVWMLPTTTAYIGPDLALELVRAGAIMLYRMKTQEAALLVDKESSMGGKLSGEWPATCIDTALEEAFAAARMLGCLEALGLTKGAVRKTLAHRLKTTVAAVEQHAFLTPEGVKLINRLKTQIGPQRLEVVH